LFVVHSLGGIIVKNVSLDALSNNMWELFMQKQALVISWRRRRHEFEDIASTTTGICFLGTPHQGSNRMTWLKAIEGIAKSTQLNSNASIILRKSDGIESAAKIDEEFFSRLRHGQGAKRLRIMNFYEELKTKYAGIVCHSCLSECS
jgi:hypothetical protein